MQKSTPRWQKMVVVLAVYLIAATMFSGCASTQDTIFKGMLKFERSRSDVTVKTIQVGDRVAAYMERAGAPGGETIVLLHGFTANKDNWVRFIPYIPASYRVLAIDMPGHGESTQNMSERYAVIDLVQRLSAAIDQMGLDRFHIAGNSLGGLVSIHYALAHPDKVITLGLFNAAGVESPTPSKLHKMAAEGDNFLLPKTKGEFYRLMGFTFCDQPFMPWPAKPSVAREYVTNYEFNKKMWNDIHSREKEDMILADRLKTLTVPTLILWGDTDNLLHVSSVGVFESLIPNHQTVIMKDCGHVPMMERPKETAEHYLKFIESATRSES